MIIKPNAQYNETINEVQKNRDCMEGEFIIKSKTTTYLKYPGLGGSSRDASIYNAYIDGAEFDEYPSVTKEALIGKFKFGDTSVEIPANLEYLIDDADGDGLSLQGLIESTAENILEAKYHILLAELPGTEEVDTSKISIADQQSLKIRAVIRSYTRESLIDWQFSYINCAKQLTLLVFREEISERKADLSIENKKSYLVCGIDEIGYYQQRWIEGGAIAGNQPISIADSDKIYPEVSGKVLKWIPVEIISDKELQSGSLPKSGGYLSKICNAALARYRVSADYKEALRNGVPTLFTKGWTTGDQDLFKELNGGREYVQTGAGVTNALPNQVEVFIEGTALEDSAFINYFKDNAEKARALGARFADTSSNTNTATEAVINEGNETSFLESLAMNLEFGIRRAVLYCGMFNGLFGQENIEANLDQIKIDIPREFSSVELTADEARAIKDLVHAELMSKETAVTKLVQGGFTPIDAEEELARIENDSAENMAKSVEQAKQMQEIAANAPNDVQSKPTGSAQT